MSAAREDPGLVELSKAVLAEHGRSFSLAGRFLPPARRGEAAIVYAFCRLADDLVDEADDALQARSDVQRLREEVRGHAPARPVVAAALRILEPVGTQPMLDLIDGVISDLDFVVPADDAALERYCYQVAGTVGLMMCAVIGVDDRTAWPRAIDLGLGMQLTNICRDVKEDAAMGRVYLPRTRLDAVGVKAADLLEGTADPNAVTLVVRDVLDRADGFYASARVGYPAIPFRSRLAIAIAARLYGGIGHKLRRSGGNPMHGRTIVGPIEKAWLITKALPDIASSAPLVPSNSHSYLQHDLHSR